MKLLCNKTPSSDRKAAKREFKMRTSPTVESKSLEQNQESVPVLVQEQEPKLDQGKKSLLAEAIKFNLKSSHKLTNRQTALCGIDSTNSPD
jgi:hypothetical protein